MRVGRQPCDHVSRQPPVQVPSARMESIDVFSGPLTLPRGCRCGGESKAAVAVRPRLSAVILLDMVMVNFYISGGTCNAVDTFSMAGLRSPGSHAMMAILLSIPSRLTIPPSSTSASWELLEAGSLSAKRPWHNEDGPMAASKACLQQQLERLAPSQASVSLACPATWSLSPTTPHASSSHPKAANR